MNLSGSSLSLLPTGKQKTTNQAKPSQSQAKPSQAKPNQIISNSTILALELGNSCMHDLRSQPANPKTSMATAHPAIPRISVLSFRQPIFDLHYLNKYACGY